MSSFPLYLPSGARAETSTRVKGGEGQESEGVRGLKALGVRDLTYRLAFLACTVLPSSARVSITACMLVRGELLLSSTFHP